MSEKILTSRPRENVVLLQIHCPPVNALGSEPREILGQELAKIESDVSVRAVVLTGHGKAFCAGDDLREAMTRGENAGISLAQFGRLCDQIENLRVPVIGAINGYAIGGGLELALCCSIRLASPNASFLAAGVNVGLMASVHRLPRLIGLGAASAMILTGLPIDAARAEKLGLVQEIHAEGVVIEAALDLAARIASRAPLSVEASKRAILRSFDLTPAQASAAMEPELTILATSNDHKEGVAAFISRQPPRFTRS